jgi:3-hydroxybutyrate dehydrogenase
MLKNKVALITGGGRGIGRAIALEFAKHGARVAIAGRTIEHLNSTVAELTELGAEAVGLTCDVSDPASVDQMFVGVRQTFGTDPHILVNNAGIAETAPLIGTSNELWDKHLAINLSGTFYCSRSALPAMLENKWGRIINIASIAGKTGSPYISAYAASKHGVMGLTRSVALEVGATGITVNAICPGYVDTEMVSRGIDKITQKTKLSADEALDALKQKSPQNRLVTAEEVAALALLLASDEGRGINGQGINVDGGSVLF